MRPVICIVLCLLLCGCAAPVQTEQTVAATDTSGAAAVPIEPSFADSLTVTERYTEPEDPEMRLAWRRDLVEARMRQMMSMLWTPEQDIIYNHDEEPQILKAGRIYRGMPYAHGSGSGMSFLTFASGQDENGVYTISGLEGARMTGQIDSAHISNDCADAVFWAWGAVSGSISFGSTSRMTQDYGCVPVGEYVCNQTSYSTSTTRIAEENGMECMYQSYAQMQKADGMVRFTDGGAGHAVMVSSVHVVRNQDGSINGDESYVLVLEQVSGNLAGEATYYDEAIDQTVYIGCGVDNKMTFRALYKIGYLPITCKELIDPTPLAEEHVSDSVDMLSEATALTGVLESNYRISHATMTIYDAQGIKVQQTIGYNLQQNMYRFKVPQLRGNSVIEINRGDVDLNRLPAGSYRCVLTCTVSTGRTLTVRDFTFTKE